MSDHATRVTGFVIPVGNGAVGKTTLALTLSQESIPASWHQQIQEIRKSKNLEFEFVPDYFTYHGQPYKVLQQYLIPPGQKREDGSVDGRSFDDVMDIYRFHIRRIDVAILSYKITAINTFHDIEFWVRKVVPLINDRTNFILVGTHLDLSQAREVDEDRVAKGRAHITKLMKKCQPSWHGYCLAMEVSNMSGENIRRLRNLISCGILHARGIII